MAGKIRLIGAVGIKVRPDTTEFKKELREQIRTLPDYDIKVKVDADTTPAGRAIKATKDKAEADTINLRVDTDFDGVKRGLAKVEAMLKGLDGKDIPVTLDRPGMLKAKRELEQMAKNAKVEFKFVQDEAGYKSVLAKINSVRRQKLVKEIKFGTDEKSMREAEAKAKAALARIEANKTVTINYGSGYDGIQSAIDDVDKRLEALRQLKITTKLDRKSLMEARAKLVKQLSTAPVRMQVTPDKEGYETVLKRIKEIQRQKLEKKVYFKTDDESLAEAEEKYKALLKEQDRAARALAREAEVLIEYNEDLKGYETALKHIKEIERKRLVKELEITSDPAQVAAEIAKFEALVAENTPPKTVELRYKENRDSLAAAIKKLDAELAKIDEIELKVDLDSDSLIAERTRLQTLMNAKPLFMRYNNDKAGYESVMSKIRELQRQRAEIPITIDTSDEGLKKAHAIMQAKLDALGNLKAITALELDQLSKEEALEEAKKLNEQIAHMKASMKVELAGSELTAARLSFLGRDRIVNYFARVNTASILAAEGMLKSLGGINTLSSIGKGLEGLFTKFDTFSLKVGAAAVALGNFANVGVYAFTSMVKVGEGVVGSLGALAAAPAVLGAATVGYTIFTAAFNNFFDAFNKDPKIAESSLAALPPLARKTVNSITGLYKGLANPIQERFWEHVGSTLADSIETLYPKLKESLLDSTTAVGDFVAGIGKSMNKLALSEDFDKMFAGFKGFFVNLSGASEPFFDGWNKFGVQGSALLPQFGTWITNMAVRFDEWATTMSANGGITDMINGGVNSLKEMWKVGGSTVDIFKAIARAAGVAGTGGLAEFQINLRKTADTMLSEPWQSRAANIFEGARAGASALNGGFHDLTGELGESSLWLGNVLDLLGQIGGESLSRLSDVFSTETYKNGITAELEGMKILVGDLGPSFVSVGRIIGNLGVIAGSVFSNMAPVINQVTELLDTVTTKLAENVADVAPKMLATIGGVFRVIEPVATGLANIVNGLLGIVGKVPDGFVLAGVAATAFFALRALSSKFYESLSGTKAFQNLNSNWLAQQAQAGKTVTSWKMVNGEMQKFTVPTDRFNAFTAGMGQLRSSAGSFIGDLRNVNEAAQMRRAGEGIGRLGQQLGGLQAVGGSLLKSGLGGLMGALGGPWGLAIGAAAAGIAIFAQNQQNAKAHIDDVTASIDRQTGALNEQGLIKIAKAWTDLDEAGDAGANFTRGVVHGLKSADETARKMGLSFSKITTTIAGSGPEREQLLRDLDAVAAYKSALERSDSTRGGADAFNLQQLKADAEGAGFALNGTGLQIDGLNAKDINHLRDNIASGMGVVDQGRVVTDGLAQSTEKASATTAGLAESMRVIRDDASDAASQISAINKALDLLKGGEVSAREAEIRAAEATRTALQEAKDLKEELKGGQGLIKQSTGLIDETSAVGVRLQRIMATQADEIKNHALTTYKAAIKAGEEPAEAMTKAIALVDAGKLKLADIAREAGVDQELIRKEWEGFYGQDWELKAIFTGDADKFYEAKLAVEAAGIQWGEQEFEAFLKANPDLATMSTLQVQEAAKVFANGHYEAQLRAMNPEALQKILEVTGQAENYKNGDYIAVMQALNSTDPGVQAAMAGLWAAVNNGGQGWAAAIRAYTIATDIARARIELDNLAATRTARIAVQIDRGEMPALDPRTGLPTNADGSVSYAPGRYVPKLAPTSYAAFANGGISVEKPNIAKIYSPAAQFRLFAEPSTGGEAFIPMSAAKRGRSTQILAEVAQQFGYKLTSNNSQAFANGGIVSRDRTGGSVSVSIGNYTTQSNDTPDDVARALMRRVKVSGVYAPLEGF